MNTHNRYNNKTTKENSSENSENWNRYKVEEPQGLEEHYCILYKELKIGLKKEYSLNISSDSHQRELAIANKK